MLLEKKNAVFMRLTAFRKRLFRITRERLGLDAETTTEENSAAVLKYLESHPLHCLAELALPIETDLEPEIVEACKALHTNYQTTVMANDVGADMKVSYIADTKLYIDNKLKQLVTANQAYITNLLSLMPLETQAAMIDTDTNNILDNMEVITNE